MNNILLKLYYTKLNKVSRDETMRVYKHALVYIPTIEVKYISSLNMLCNGYVNFEFNDTSISLYKIKINSEQR